MRVSLLSGLSARSERRFLPGQVDGPAVRRVSAGFHGSEMMLLVGTGHRWSAGVREGIEPGQDAGDHVGEGPVLCQAEDAVAANGDELGGGGEQSQS